MKKRVNYEKVKELALQGKRVKEIAKELGNAILKYYL